MSFICDTCKQSFSRKQSLNRHKLTPNVHDKYESNKTVFTCVCGKKYLHRQSLQKHKYKCEKAKADRDTYSKSDVNVMINEMEQKMVVYEQRQKDFEKERDELYSQISLLLDKQAGIHNTSNTNNTNIENQNNTINIHINAFGSENTEYLDDKAILQCIDRVYKSIPAIIEKLHFNPQHPENHNIKITNKKLPYASVMGNNKRWKTVDRKDAIDKMVTNGYYMLDEKYETNKDKFDPRKQKNFESFKNNFEIEEKNTMKMVKGDVEMLVINGPSLE